MKVRSQYATAIILIICSLFFFNQIISAERAVYIVDTPSLTVRSEPAADASPIGYLYKGEQVTVFETVNGWARSYYNNEKGWVAPQYLYPVTLSTNVLHNEKNDIFINKEGVRIRSGPGTEYPVYSVAGYQDRYEIIDTSNGWQQIVLENGETGWVASWLTTNEKNPKEAKAEKPPLDGYTIVLDAGHGGKDPGAIAIDNTYEKNLTLATVKKTAELLKKNGATIIMTREEDVDISLDKRTEISNKSFADVFISFHYNSSIHSNNRGTQTYFFEHDNNRALAEHLQSRMAEYLPLPNSGVKEADFRVLKNNQNPAALVELGFLSNQDDMNVIHGEEFQKNAATAITEGLIDYFNQK